MPTIHYSSSSVHPRSTVVQLAFGSAPPGGRSAGRYPAAGVKGITVERSSNRVGVSAPPRPPMLAIGIIGGMADCVPAGAAEMAGLPPTCLAGPAGGTGGAAPVQAYGTVSARTEVARPIPAESAGAPEPTAPMPAGPRAPVLDVSPTACAAPSSLAAVVAALAAVGVLPAVNSLDSMLMGIDASLSGVLSSFMTDVGDVEDVDESVAVDATPSRACGDARHCRA